MICDTCEKKHYCEDPCKEAVAWKDLGDEYRIKDVFRRIKRGVKDIKLFPPER